MKKTLYNIFLATATVLASSCTSILDKKPLDIISDGVVWEDESLINSYLTQLYYYNTTAVNETAYTFADVGDWLGPGMGWAFINEIADEAVCLWRYNTEAVIGWKAGGINAANPPVNLEWWDQGYKQIRQCTYFLDNISKSKKLSASFIKTRSAEARFLRAFAYFALVKRYGGVPLITKVQQITDDEKILYPARNKEQEIYDYILSECDICIDNLPSVCNDTDLGRATANAARALKCRVALYAASIAEFGEVKLDGLVGIPKKLAPKYYQSAYDTANQIIESKRFSLYEKHADKTKNFQNIFLDENNSETIWAVRHVGTSWAASFWIYDFAQCPKNAWSAGNKDMPYLEFVEEFEHIDGTSGKFDNSVFATDKLWTIQELWADRDPRLFATIYTQETEWQGNLVDYHKGLILPNGTIKDDTGSYEGVMSRGNYGADGSMGSSMGVMKYLDPNHDNSSWQNSSSTDYIVFRYAEVFLNLAEAALQLGHADIALEAVNKIRRRAGIAELTFIDHKAIEHERKVELAFEGHRYWDVRRWRVAEEELTGDRYGLQYILDFNTRKYRIKKVGISTGATGLRFGPQHYYFPIGITRIGVNGNLVENPGY